MLKILLFWKEIKERGQTLVEVIVAMCVLAVLALGISGAASLTMRVSHESERKNIALGIANEEMEFVRSIAYNDVGFDAPQDNDPSGILGYNEQVTRNRQTYSISRRIEYVDDPLTALADDFKKVQMLVSWLAPNSVTNQASLVTYISEDEICPDQFCPPGLRFDRVLCECVEVHEPELPDCVGSGFSCLATEDECIEADGSLRSNYDCSTGTCCQVPEQCTDQSRWNATTDTYDPYSCVPLPSDCAGYLRVNFHCDSGVCCQPPLDCMSDMSSNICMESESACESVEGQAVPFTCANEGESCCRMPTQCGAYPYQLEQHCRPTESDCAANGEVPYIYGSCALQGGGVCCQTMDQCEADYGYDCMSSESECANIDGSVRSDLACDPGICCVPPPQCTDQGYWDGYASAAHHRNYSCVPTESDCLGVLSLGYECDSGVCCKPPPDCESNGYSCLGNGQACFAQHGLIRNGYSCAVASQICCERPEPTPTGDPPSICSGPMICSDECNTSTDCQTDRPNTAGPCYFKNLPTGNQQCGRDIFSWACVDNQWSLHCADSYGQEGESCTNGCSWVPPTGCTQKHCPADSTCDTNWGGRMDLCRQNTSFISGGCVDQTDPMTGLHECIDTSDGTCYGALCETSPPPSP
ncbi:MAG TPA: hypothetical protein DDW41_07095 [Candidatus Andersenbacteria bacterium]|nr:hypothetical protein [Candidatus Andersenbacteria bacterium]